MEHTLKQDEKKKPYAWGPPFALLRIVWYSGWSVSSSLPHANGAREQNAMGKGWGAYRCLLVSCNLAWKCPEHIRLKPTKLYGALRVKW